MRNPHIQTFWPATFRPFPLFPRIRERLTLPDGDFIDVDWAGPQTHTAPVVLLIHGLTGSSSSLYMVGLQQVLAQHNIRSVAMNCRGASGALNLRARIYHAGASDDIDAVISILAARFPQVPLFAVGYSLGGNMLLKWLGEQHHALTAAVAVSVPYDLGEVSERVNSGSSRLYRHILLTNLKRLLNRKIHHSLQAHDTSAHPHPSNYADLERFGDINRWRTFRDFDHNVMAPLHNFAGVEEYYQNCSSKHFLPTIQTPTLLIHAKDDPLMTPNTAPETNQLPPNVQLELSEHGGHVGFIAGSPRHPVYWLEQRIPRFIRDHL